MGSIQGFLGNASKADASEFIGEWSGLIAKDETVISAYKLIRDWIAITDKRLIRNAFAHGAFEIKGSGAKQLFLFERRRGDVLQGRIRLLKSNVDRILSISKMTRDEILKLRLKQR